MRNESSFLANPFRFKLALHLFHGHLQNKRGDTTAGKEEEIMITASELVIEPHTRKKPGAVFIKTYPKAPSIMPIINGLEQLFDKINEKFFNSELSKIVITLSEEGRRSTYGWFTVQQVWQDAEEVRYHEINICPEYLNRPINEVCGTLLHEMVHLKCSQDGIQDCSNGGRYHNKKFKLYAEKHGLNVTKTEKYGFADTTLKPETIKFINALKLESFELFRNLNFGDSGTEIDDEGEQGGSLKPSSTRKYVCPKCDLSIRATKDVRVRCDECDVLFVKQT